MNGINTLCFAVTVNTIPFDSLLIASEIFANIQGLQGKYVLFIKNYNYFSEFSEGSMLGSVQIIFYSV